MTLPNFIGLGVQKGGTSWLHAQLAEHPEVCVPQSRKEIHYFDWYFERGINWYQKWFPKDASKYKAVGEITPEYLYFEDVLPRIKQTVPDAKFIIILRHPVKRAFSHYQMIFQSGDGFNYKDFNDFMENHPHGFKRGLYASQIQRWFEAFNPDRFLILYSEELSSSDYETKETFKKIGHFLDINPDLFNLKNAQKRVGKARSIPKNPKLMKFAQTVRQKLRDWDLDTIAYGLKKIGITRQLLVSKKSMPVLYTEDNEKWMKAYSDDIRQLEKLLNRSFSSWT